MQKTKLVIASILKPVDDTRMYEKFGLSLGQTNKYDINIIGFLSKNIPHDPHITFHPINNFSRLSFRRLVAPIKCFRLLIRLKPEILIINTHELLIVTWLYKIFFGCKLLYDIQENYYRNILYTKAFPIFLKPIIAGYVRAKEYVSALFVNHYFLAERQYEDEFSFSKGKSSVIENKFKPPLHPVVRSRKDNKIRLIFSGTLAISTGVFHAVEIAQKMHQLDNRVELLIIGHCSISSTLEKLKRLIKPLDFITLTGGKDLVPHQQVLQAIYNADFGIVYYPKNYSTMNSTPTKLFEYLGCHLPILLQNHTPWVKLAQEHNACMVLKAIHEIDQHFIDQMETTRFYQNADDNDILWLLEEEKLINIVREFLE